MLAFKRVTSQKRSEMQTNWGCLEYFEYLTPSHPRAHTHAHTNTADHIWILNNVRLQYFKKDYGRIFYKCEAFKCYLVNVIFCYQTGSRSEACMDAHTENVTSVKCAYLCWMEKKNKQHVKSECEFINATWSRRQRQAERQTGVMWNYRLPSLCVVVDFSALSLLSGLTSLKIHL